MVGNSDRFEVAPTPMEQNGKADKVSIKFGSHDEPSKAEETSNNNEVSKSDGPKDVSEEWPAQRKLHAFYFVKQRSYEDPKIKAKLDQLDKEHQKFNTARAGVFDKLKAKRAEKSELFDLLEPLKSERKGFNNIFDEKKKKMEPLQQALGKLRSNDGVLIRRAEGEKFISLKRSLCLLQSPRQSQCLLKQRLCLKLK